VTPALSAFDELRATLYRDGLLIPHLDDLRSIAVRLHAIAEDRAAWIAQNDPEMREIEDHLHDAALAALLAAVEAVAR